MGSRGSDTSPRRDAVWHQLYSASYIYTEEREKDKTVNIFFVDLYILQTVTRNLESMGMAHCYYFLHQIIFPCAWKVCTELQVSAVNKDRELCLQANPQGLRQLPGLCPSDKGPRSHGQLPASFDGCSGGKRYWFPSSLICVLKSGNLISNATFPSY